MENCCCCYTNLILIAVGLLLYLLKKRAPGAAYKKTNLIEDKVVIITGANTGLGKVTATDLAKRGGRIYIACRDAKRGENAVRDIRKESGSESVYFLSLDLSSLESVREFSKKFHEREDKLHILINNAGLAASPEAKTKDGFEMTMGVNHLGHFLLTHLLLDLLEASAPSRIVNVSSTAYYFTKIEHDDFDGGKSVSGFSTYSKSKLANILFTRHLAKVLEGSNVTVNCCHPGIIPTKITRNMKVPDMLYNTLLKPFLKTPVEGAQTQICLALDPALSDVSGKYFEDCKQVKPWSHAEDDAAAEWLYRKSCQLVKL